MDTQSEKAMYQLMVTAPIREIIKDLNGPFTYQIDFLNPKLQSYMEIAAQTVGLSPSLVRDERQPEIRNKYAKEYYLKYFQFLLEHFEKWA